MALLSVKKIFFLWREGESSSSSHFPPFQKEVRQGRQISYELFSTRCLDFKNETVFINTCTIEVYPSSVMKTNDTRYVGVILITLIPQKDSRNLNFPSLSFHFFHQQNFHCGKWNFHSIFLAFTPPRMVLLPNFQSTRQLMQYSYFLITLFCNSSRKINFYVLVITTRTKNQPYALNVIHRMKGKCIARERIEWCKA